MILNHINPRVYADLPFFCDGKDAAEDAPSEVALQSRIVSRIPEFFPGFRAFANVNEGKRHVGRGMAAKRAGLSEGWPDLTIIGPARFIAFVEVKLLTDLSDGQRRVLRWLHDNGHRAAMVRSAASLRQLMEAWLAVR